MLFQNNLLSFIAVNCANYVPDSIKIGMIVFVNIYLKYVADG